MDKRKLTFGQHLEELRACILRGLLWILLAFILALVFQSRLMELISRPHREAIAQFSEGRSRESFERSFRELGNRALVQFRALEAERERFAELEAELQHLGSGPSPELEARVDELEVMAESTRVAGDRAEAALRAARAHGLSAVPAELAESFEGWKSRLKALRARADSLRERLPDQGASLHMDARLRALRYPESFIAHLKMALIVALLAASPLAGRELWRFVAAGLHDHEKRSVQIFAPASLLLFLVGVLFGYTVLIPLGLGYMASYGDPELIELGITLSDYLSLFMILTVFLGLVFQTPLILLFLGKLGLVDSARLRKGRRYVILLAFVVGALLTPPDPITQVLMALPLIVLFELGILLVGWLGKPMAQEKGSSGYGSEVRGEEFGNGQRGGPTTS